MKQFNFDSINYAHKEELKTFLSSFNELIDKYGKTFASKNGQLSKINAEITRKRSAISKLEVLGNEYAKREEELKSLRTYTASDIKSLEAKKKSIDYTDSEVQKMEKEDIDILITSKKNKISKIDAKLESTRSKINENKLNKKTFNDDLRELEIRRKQEEETQFRTNAIIGLIGDAKEKLNGDLYNIITKIYISEQEKVKEEPKKEIEPEPTLDIEETDDSVACDDVEIQEVEDDVVINEDEDINIDYDTPKSVYEAEIDEPTLDIEPIVKEIAESNETNPLEETGALSLLDLDEIELPDEAIPTSSINADDEMDCRKMVEDTFQKEGINYESFDEETQIKLVENANKVLKNLIVLKKHQIPLELTIKQPKIYYNISPQDLDDLLNIITVDDDGNGMGFSIDYAFYILDELSQVNVDKLIEVYNNEFMNVNSKSGLIKLLKMANSNLQDFETNRMINIDTLKSLGVTNTDVIEKEYKDFVDLDNPLFLNALNLFDKNDLVNKINADVKIIPKIMEYWLNN